MRVLIIEDEINAANDLRQTLGELNPSFTVEAVLDSIESALAWFKKNPQPDLIFSDIQLADGLSFDIFKQVPITCPVIFCTAYDEYALKAFETSGVDYLLKPIEETKLARSLAKINDLSRHFSKKSTDIESMLLLLQQNLKTYKTSLLVTAKGKMFPVDCSAVACFSVENKVTRLYTLNGQKYIIPQTLDELEQELNPIHFYRASRQHLVAFKAIREVEQYFARKLYIHLSIKTAEPVTVSKPRSPHFLSWMQNR